MMSGALPVGEKVGVDDDYEMIRPEEILSSGDEPEVVKMEGGRWRPVGRLV